MEIRQFRLANQKGEKITPEALAHAMTAFIKPELIREHSQYTALYLRDEADDCEYSEAQRDAAYSDAVEVITERYYNDWLETFTEALISTLTDYMQEMVLKLRSMSRAQFDKIIDSLNNTYLEPATLPGFLDEHPAVDLWLDLADLTRQIWQTHTDYLFYRRRVDAEYMAGHMGIRILAALLNAESYILTTDNGIMVSVANTWISYGRKPVYFVTDNGNTNIDENRYHIARISSKVYDMLQDRSVVVLHDIPDIDYNSTVYPDTDNDSIENDYDWEISDLVEEYLSEEQPEDCSNASLLDGYGDIYEDRYFQKELTVIVAVQDDHRYLYVVKSFGPFAVLLYDYDLTNEIITVRGFSTHLTGTADTEQAYAGNTYIELRLQNGYLDIYNMFCPGDFRSGPITVADAAELIGRNLLMDSDMSPTLRISDELFGDLCITLFDDYLLDADKLYEKQYDFTTADMDLARQIANTMKAAIHKWLIPEQEK